MALTQQDIDDRFEFGTSLIAEAGALAMTYFNSLGSLDIKSKGPQDFVSEADYNTEVLIKDAIKARFPDDAFFGEETGPTGIDGAEGIWVVDPIDGTQPFLMGMTSWCVSIAFIRGEEMLIGLVYSPAGNEFFAAQQGKGATLNGGMYHRNGSGALGVCYVGSGALIGYIEHHINAWDCLAGLLIVQEAGGRTNDFIRDNGLHHGGNIIAATPALYDQLKSFVPSNPPLQR
jgi:myo-inositol-1(or 4)-monophosphatase